MTKVIVLNGPPECGKDESTYILDNYLWETLPLYCMSFKMPLYEIVAAIYGVEADWVFEVNDDREVKDIPQKQLGGKSVRQTLIEVSEGVIKPYYGKDFFGQTAVKTMKGNSSKLFIFSDSGFEEELEPVSNYVGKENVILCRIRNRGTFSNDSRSFLSDKHAGTVLDYDNSGSLHELHDWVESVGDMILKELEIDATGC